MNVILQLFYNYMNRFKYPKKYNMYTMTTFCTILLRNIIYLFYFIGYLFIFNVHIIEKIYIV